MDFTLNTSIYQADINAMVYELGADAQKLLREEMRLLLRDIIALTPPKTFPQGRNAVATDLAKVYITTKKIAKELDKSSPGASVAFYRAMKRGDTVTAAQIAVGGSGTTTVRVKSYSRGGKHGSRVKTYQRTAHTFASKIPGLTPNTSFAETLDPQVHIRRRDKYGRVRGNFISQIVDDAKGYAAYLKTLWDRVGFAKAGWVAAYKTLGGQPQDFIARLAGVPRSSFAEVTSQDEKSITVSTTSSKIPGYERFVLEAMRNRERSMANEIARLKLGGGSRRGSFADTPIGAPS